MSFPGKQGTFSVDPRVSHVSLSVCSVEQLLTCTNKHVGANLVPGFPGKTLCPSGEFLPLLSPS